MVSSSAWVFFFQAEDGIRDLVRSRGLGDVYKRQSSGGAMSALLGARLGLSPAHIADLNMQIRNTSVSVSYTNLTLPTSDLV